MIRSGKVKVESFSVSANWLFIQSTTYCIFISKKHIWSHIQII